MNEVAFSSKLRVSLLISPVRSAVLKWRLSYSSGFDSGA